MRKTVTMGDLGNIITGNTPPRSHPELYGNYTPFVKATDISETEKYARNPEEGYSKEGYNKYIKSLIPKDSTCVVTIGSIGKKMTMAHCDMFINQAMNAIIPNKKFDKEFVYYAVKNVLGNIKGLDSGTASGRENVSKSAFSRMEILVDDNISVQHRIATILSRYDSLIENYQKQIKLLEEAAQRLYKEWFIDLRFPGHENVKVVDGIPEGWEKKKISDVSDLSAGKDKPSIVCKNTTTDCTIPVYSNGITEEGLYGYTNEARINEESVTISARGTIGYAFLRLHPYVPIVRLLVLIPQKGMNAKFIYHWANNKEIRGNGAAQQQLTVPLFKDEEILIPNQELLNLYESKVNNIFTNIDKLKTQIRSLTEARDRMLPKLMSGEIEV